MEINYEAIRKLIIQLKTKINSKIDAIDITDEQKSIIQKIDNVITTENGLNYLSDDGTYKSMNLEDLNELYKRINDIWDVFNIVKDDTFGTLETAVSDSNLANGDCYSCITPDGKIHIVGGHEKYTRHIIYDCNTDTLSISTPTPVNVQYSAIQYYNGNIFVISNNTTIVYNIALDSWSTLNGKLDYNIHGSCIYNKKIYIFNAYDLSLDYVYVYDCELDTISTFMERYNNTMRAAVCNKKNKVYYIGGASSSNTYSSEIIEYDLDLKVSTLLGNLIYDCSGNGAVIKDNYIYVCGGVGSSSYLKSIAQFNIKDKTSKKVENITIPTNSTNNMNAAEYNGYVYIYGGYDGNYSPYMLKLKIPNMSYDLVLPENIQNKINNIVTTGDGTKILADNGEYVDFVPSNYRTMTDDEINALLEEVKGV